MMTSALIGASNDQDPQELHNLIFKHNNKNDDFNLKELLQVCSRKHQEELWLGLYGQMAHALSQAPISREDKNEDLGAIITCLQDIVTIAGCVLDQNNLIIPDKMLETITALHELLLEFPEAASKLQSNIAKICLTWWVRDAPGKEHLVANTIMFFLVKSLQPSASHADVKRVFTLRGSLLQIDYEDDNSITLKNLLLRCVINPVFLKAEEGRRFLSYLFGLNLPFIEQLHKAIKNQIPACPKPMIEWYGVVYFKAWKSASGLYVDKIEDCIQDLMCHAVHASRAGARSMSSTLRKFLGSFHKQKLQQGVDKMLLKLYNPILWRSLKVANGTVRANAVALLIDAFPLQDPDDSNEAKDSLLQKQFDILADLLSDPCIIVRATCVTGVCRIANVFWELIPIGTLEELLTKLVQDLARDMASTDVRAAVYKGLASVLDNHLSHSLMKRLLPQLGLLVHDSSEKVRVAFVELILKVKGVRSIKVSDVVPMEHLLVRMQLDSPPVVRRLVQLLFNSFQPLDKAGEVQLTRCIALIQTNTEAARVFYRYAHRHMSPNDTVKFLLLLCQCIMGCIRRSSVDTNGNASKEAENENATEEDTLSLADKDIIDGLLEVMVILWTGVDHQLTTTHTSLRPNLVKRFSKAIPKFIQVFQDGRSLEAVLLLASFLPGSALPDFNEQCLDKLKTLSPASSVHDFSPLLECLVSWGKGGDVLKTINHWLENFEEEGSLAQFNVALRMLDWLLAQQTTRSVIMQANHEHLLLVMSTLQSIMKSIEMNKALDSDRESHLEQALYTYCKTVIHVQAETAEPDIDMVGDLLTSLMTSIDQDILFDTAASETQHFRWIKCVLTVIAESFMVGLVTDDIGRNITGFLAIILQKYPSLELLPSIVHVLYHVSLKHLTTPHDQLEEDDVVPLQLAQIIKLLALRSKDGDSEMHKILPAIKPGMTEVLRCYYRNHPDNCQRILASIMAATISELTSVIRQNDEKLKPCQHFNELPTLSAFLLTLVNIKSHMLSCFLMELEQCICVGAVQDIAGLLATLHVLYTTATDGKKIEGLKGCVSLVQQRINSLKQNLQDDSEQALYEEAGELIECTTQHLGCSA